MANTAPIKKASQFFICNARLEWLEGKHVVFRKVKDDTHHGSHGSSGSRNNKTSKIVIADCEQV
jgi:peptidylprolyl isomerase